MPIRCFVSVDIEDPSVMSKVESLQRELLLTHADLRLVNPKSIHLTLLFLGEVEETVAKGICGVLRGKELSPKKVRLEGLGLFPSASRPNVVWIGIASGAEELNAAACRVASLLKPFGFSPDEKGFQAHVTIARVRSGRNKDRLLEKVRELGRVQVGEVSTSPVRLKKSTLTPVGPIYETLCEAVP
ncbi:MAG: RNA 2',3'-cyclic phosphodiesterase [Candidatus Brockarchaeota archaeon]|nr:RNA 2',3'-cyclic phosphodiesterase [Candidatus Brockarchaeota archaeon]